MIMQTFLSIFWYFLAIRHPNDRIKAFLDLYLANLLHKSSKTKVPKDGSFQWFLESIVYLFQKMPNLQKNKQKVHKNNGKRELKINAQASKSLDVTKKGRKSMLTKAPKYQPQPRSLGKSGTWRSLKSRGVKCQLIFQWITEGGLMEL